MNELELTWGQHSFITFFTKCLLKLITGLEYSPSCVVCKCLQPIYVNINQSMVNVCTDCPKKRVLLLKWPVLPKSQRNGESLVVLENSAQMLQDRQQYVQNLWKNGCEKLTWSFQILSKNKKEVTILWLCIEFVPFFRGVVNFKSISTRAPFLGHPVDIVLHSSYMCPTY